jgi:NADH-quinone oxidoreductase subunit G
MTKQVTLTIDGSKLLSRMELNGCDAAKMAGIDIPVFCHHPKLEPVGMCRMCLVEIGRPMLDRATGQVVMENGAAQDPIHAQAGNRLHQSVSEEAWL